jgi:hypothetical protein
MLGFSIVCQQEIDASNSCAASNCPGGTESNAPDPRLCCPRGIYAVPQRPATLLASRASRERTSRKPVARSSSAASVTDMNCASEVPWSMVAGVARALRCMHMRRAARVGTCDWKASTPSCQTPACQRIDRRLASANGLDSAVIGLCCGCPLVVAVNETTTKWIHSQQRA